MLISCKRKINIDYLKLKVSNEFEMNDVGPVKRILEMDIVRTFGKLFWSQQLCLEKRFKKIFNA